MIGEHELAMFGTSMMGLIALCLLVAIWFAASEKLKEWKGWHERKWKIERMVDDFDRDLTKLEKRVDALEAKEGGE